MSKLVFNTDTNSIIITGKTFSIKDLLKTHGARWDAATGAWSLPIAKDTPEFRAELSAAVTTAASAKKAEAAWLKSPEGIAATRAAAAEAEKARLLAALAQKVASGGLKYHWVCCAECKVIDWKSAMTHCRAHADAEGNYTKKNGAIYTGD